MLALSRKLLAGQSAYHAQTYRQFDDLVQEDARTRMIPLPVYQRHYPGVVHDLPSSAMYPRVAHHPSRRSPSARWISCAEGRVRVSRNAGVSHRKDVVPISAPSSAPLTIHSLALSAMTCSTTTHRNQRKMLHRHASQRCCARHPCNSRQRAPSRTKCCGRVR